MALRIANKINRQFVKNVCRSLSTKRDITDLEYGTPRNNDDASGETGTHSNNPISPSNPVQYQVCQPRAANRSGGPTLVVNLQSQRNAVKNETEVAKNAMAMQHLQPALLPEYYKPPVEINSSIYQDTTNEQEKQSSIKKARKFEESSTRLNLTRPLKAPKLANPFPEPVKVMPSHTVCDKEKAELMLAEQKMAARTVILPQQPHSSGHHQQHQQQASGYHQQQAPSGYHQQQAPSGYHQQQAPSGYHQQQASSSHHQQQQVLAKCQRRQYSTNGSRKNCKSSKVKAVCPDKSNKKCRRFRMPCCPPARVGGCAVRQISRGPPCKKILAPYPSFTDANCFSLPYRKPSECRMCPWPIHRHPSFKPKKDFHTEVVKKTSWVDLESDQVVNAIDADILNNKDLIGYKIHKSIVRCLENKPPCKGNCDPPKPTYGNENRGRVPVPPALPYPAPEREECKKKPKCPKESLGILGCLEHKPPCKQHKGECEETRPKTEKEKWAKEHLDKEECKEKPKKCTLSLGDQIGAWLHQTSKKTPMMDTIEAREMLSTKVHGNLQENQFIPTEESIILLKDEHPCPPNPCKKFPFKPDNFELVKEYAPAPRHRKMPDCPEKKHKLIKDCPAGPCGCYKNAPISNGFDHQTLDMGVSSGGGMMGPPPTGGNGGGIGYLLDDGGCGPSKKPPCKKFEKPKCKEEEPEKEECDRGLHPRSAICPKDAGFELHYKRPKFIPKTEEEIEQDRENKKNKKTKGFEEIPLILPPVQPQIYPYMSISSP